MPEDIRYPRALVVDACPFNRNRNNGILKSTLFEGWPPDRLAAIDYSNQQPGFDVCERYWRLTKTDIVRALCALPPIAGVMAKPRKLAGSAFDPALAFQYEGRPRLEQKLSFLNGDLRTCLGEVLLAMPAALSRYLRRWVEAFQPEVLFSIGGTRYMLRTIGRISAWLGIPLVLYFTDDWMKTAYRGRLGGFVLRPSTDKWLRACLNAAPIRLTTCEAMAVEYRRRYGGSFEPLMQSVEGSLVNRALVPPPVHDAVRFVFTGSLAPNRWKSLEAIGKALQDLRGDRLEGELHIYSMPHEFEAYGRVFHPLRTVRLAGTARPADIPSIQRDADVLVHAEAFDDAARQYTQFSLSTKIPQYLAAGRCIFAYGPAELASIRYIGDSGTGIAESAESPGALRNALRRIMVDARFREATGRRAVELAAQRHDAKTQRERFRQLMAEAAAAGPLRN